jgi:hypothetical protein
MPGRLQTRRGTNGPVHEIPAPGVSTIRASGGEGVGSAQFPPPNPIKASTALAPSDRARRRSFNFERRIGGSVERRLDILSIKVLRAGKEGRDNSVMVHDARAGMRLCVGHESISARRRGKVARMVETSSACIEQRPTWPPRQPRFGGLLRWRPGPARVVGLDRAGPGGRIPERRGHLARLVAIA